MNLRIVSLCCMLLVTKSLQKSLVGIPIGFSQTGKSSFVYTVTGDKSIEIGVDDESTTKKAAAYFSKKEYEFRNESKSIMLLDVPGFHDTHLMSDEEIHDRIQQSIFEASDIESGTGFTQIDFFVLMESVSADT